MKALLIVDVQRDFCEGGSLAVVGASEIIPIINNLIKENNKVGNFIIATKDWHPRGHKSFASNSSGSVGELGELNGLPQIWWPDHCVQGSNGSEFHSELLNIRDIVYKGQDIEVDSYSAFFDNGKVHKTELDGILRGKNVDELDVVGLATDYCVKFTVLDALELGYRVNLITKGCRGVNLDPMDSKKAIEDMKARGAKIID